MSTPLNTTIISEPTPAAEAGVDNYSQPLGEASPTIITVNRLLVAQAMSLLMRLDQDLEEARAQFNQDWFRRIMRARPKAVSRLRRRWSKIVPPRRIALGSFVKNTMLTSLRTYTVHELHLKLHSARERVISSYIKAQHILVRSQFLPAEMIE